MYGIVDHISWDDHMPRDDHMPKNIADNRLGSEKKKLNEMGWMGIKAVGKWDMHPDLRGKEWCKEEHEIKK